MRVRCCPLVAHRGHKVQRQRLGALHRLGAAAGEEEVERLVAAAGGAVSAAAAQLCAGAGGAGDVGEEGAAGALDALRQAKLRRGVKADEQRGLRAGLYGKVQR